MGLTQEQKWPADKVERRKTNTLVPYARNSRTHSEQQVSQIAASIKEWGWTTPVLIDEEGGIIAGHGRVLAAQKLGIDEVPTMAATGWTKAQKQAYVLADNQLPQNAGWDMDLLSVEMKDLDAEGFDLSLMGFDDDMMANMLIEEIAMPVLPSGEKEPFQQMTFTLHDEQVEYVETATSIAKKMGAFVNSPNENGNGNALARVCEMFVGAHGNS